MERLLDEFILPAEAAKILGCNPRTVSRHVDEGKLPGAMTPFGRLVNANAVLTEARRRRFKTGAHHTPLQ